MIRIFAVLFFWILLFLIIQSYLLYPLSLVLFSFFRRNSANDRANVFPSISILISAFNEEKVIEERIENINNLEYDLSKVEVIVGSDCSTDRTNEILTNCAEKYKWLRIEKYNKRRGKAVVLNDLVNLAQNELLVFTDANTKFDKNALVNLVSEFSHEDVGGVCGRLVLDQPKGEFEKANRERLYWKYETHLKKYEGKLGVLIGANGGIYAIRKKLFTKFPEREAVTDDLYQALALLKQNFKFVYSYEAIADEDVSKEIITEFKRKIRFAATNFQTLKYFKKLLFSSNVVLSYALWSHKIIRWFVPVFLILILITNLLLVSSGQFYYDFLIAQLIFYTLTILCYLLSLIKINIPFVNMIYYYSLTNLALLIGLFKFIFKKHTYIWDSTPR